MAQTNKKPVPLDGAGFIDIISTYTPLSVAESPRGYCPLCHSDAHHFVVHAAELQWHCDSCGEGGDIYYFFEKLRRIPHEDAVRFADIMIANQMRNKSRQDRLVNSAASSRIKIVDEKAPVDASSVAGIVTDIPAANKPKINTEALARLKSRSSRNAVVQTPPTDADVEQQPVEAQTDDAGIASSGSDFVEVLLQKFAEHKGYAGMALVKPDQGTVMGATIDALTETDFVLLSEFLQSTLTAAQKVVGSFDNADALATVTLGVTLKSEDMALLLIPMHSAAYPIDIILLLHRDNPVSSFILQLKAYFKNNAYKL